MHIVRHYISLKLLFVENNENSPCHVAETLNAVLAFCQITITVLTRYQPNLYAFYTPETVIFFQSSDLYLKRSKMESKQKKTSTLRKHKH